MSAAPGAGAVVGGGVTVVIPTHDRPHLLGEAVASALEQTDGDTRVLVVDDGSTTPVQLAGHPRLQVVRHPRARGVSAARNLGCSLATTDLVTFLDDDDVLLPHMVAVSTQRLRDAADEPGPVAVLSGVGVLDVDGHQVGVRLPPERMERGSHFSLEPQPPGRSYHGKQTLVVPRQVLLDIGGFDERFPSRVVTEMFWRLNPVCTLVGTAEVTYRLRAHPGPRLSGDPGLRRRSFQRLLDTHGALLAQHPEGHARLLAEHARTSWEQGGRVTALQAGLRLARLAPRETAQLVLRAARRPAAQANAAPL